MRVLLHVAWPITAAGLTQALHHIISAWFVGRLGADAIAAVSASGALFFIFISLGSGLSAAGGVLVAQHIGAGKGETTDHVAAQTLLMVFAVGIAFATGFALVEQAVQFGGVVFPFMGFMALVQALNGAFRGAGSTRQSMTISLLMQYALQFPFAWGIAFPSPFGVLGAW